MTQEYSMSRATDAFEAALTRKCGKMYLYPHEEAPDRAE